MNVIKKLQEYDDLYYNNGTSPISDVEYDELKEKAKSENPNHPYFQKVGSKNFKTGKVDLPYILGSLEKTKLENVGDFLSKIKGPKVLTEKLDGVSLYIEYTDGEVTFAATRGDGYKGKDITEKAKIFCPKNNVKGKIALRAEAMLISNIYKEIGFRTARNGAAGILNRDDSKHCEHIVPIFYEIIEPSTNMNETDKIRYIMDFIGRIPKYYLLESDDIGEIISFLEKCKEKSEYEIDGLVITPLNYEREDVPYPENKVAFKINREPVDATVKDVEWKVTRTGKIVPIVIVDPVDFQGVTVTKATGFNYQYILENNIGKGSIVKLVRSGDVIPYIVSVSKKVEIINAPMQCPSCGKALFIKGVDLRCNNPLCDESSYYKTEYFLRTLGVENISYKTLMKLGLNKVEDCYKIDEWEISSVDGFGLKRAQQIVDEIESTLSTTPEKLLAAFGIPNVSLITSQAIMSKMSSIENVFDASISDLQMVEGIGDITAKNIVECLPNYRNLYDYLLERGLTFESRGDILKGKVFCLTGKGPMSRQNIIKMVEGEGGYVKGMSKSVDYLVCANKESNSSKAKKARKYGTKIITYEELMEILNVG